MNSPFTDQLLGWKRADKTGRVLPNFADSDNEQSIPGRGTASETGIGTGTQARDDLSASLQETDPSRAWHLDRKAVVTSFAQYSHLCRVDDLVKQSQDLRVTLGRDYLFDVTVGLKTPPADDDLSSTRQFPASGRSGQTAFRTSGTNSSR